MKIQFLTANKLLAHAAMLSATAILLSAPASAQNNTATFIAKACQAKLQPDLSALRADLAKNLLDKEDQDEIALFLKMVDEDILDVDDETECAEIGSELREARQEVADQIREIQAEALNTSTAKKEIKKKKKIKKYSKRGKKGKGKKRTAAPMTVECAEGRVKQDGLCYARCAPEMIGQVTECIAAKCPTYFRDDGLYCAKKLSHMRKPYPWIGSDGLTDKKQFERCEADQGSVKGSCEKILAIVYPRCKDGLSELGLECIMKCPTSSFTDANGKSHGWTDIGVSCKKPSYNRGVGVIPDSCPKGAQKVGLECKW